MLLLLLFVLLRSRHAHAGAKGHAGHEEKPAGESVAMNVATIGMPSHLRRTRRRDPLSPRGVPRALRRIRKERRGSEGRGCGSEHGGEIVEPKRSPQDGCGDCGASRRSWHPVESFPHAVTDPGRKPGLNQHSLRPVDPDQALLEESPEQLDQQERNAMGVVGDLQQRRPGWGAHQIGDDLPDGILIQRIKDQASRVRFGQLRDGAQ